MIWCYRNTDVCEIKAAADVYDDFLIRPGTNLSSGGCVFVNKCRTDST